MIIEKVTSDSVNIFNTDVQAIVNPVNCVGVMGKGLALEFKKHFPDNFKAYKRACDVNAIRVGEMFTVETGTLQNPKFIINFPTKKHWKDRSRIEYIKSGIQALSEEIKRLEIESISIPALGCGLGGLKWKDVKPVIVDGLKQLENVIICLFEPFIDFKKIK